MMRLTILAVLLALASPALAGSVHCTTYQEKTLGRLQTLCDDGTPAISTYDQTLERWDTTITESPKKAYTGQRYAHTRPGEARCR